jgi:hypothetical protein
MSVMSLFKNRFFRKRASAEPETIYNSNETISVAYPNLLRGEYAKCISATLAWMDSVPYSEHILKHHNEMLKMTEQELLRHCSLNYDKGISEGEKHRIYRKLNYGPVKQMIDSGVLSLMLAYSYDSLGDFGSGLMWKSHAASGGFPNGKEFLPFEGWRIVELSTVKNLSKLGYLSEVEYVKSWLSQDSLSFSYIPRYIIERDLLGKNMNIDSLDRYKATIDYQSEFYRINTGHGEMIRHFSLRGIKAIIDDAIRSEHRMTL